MTHSDKSDLREDIDDGDILDDEQDDWGEHDVFRDGQVHVREKMCKTCIFRPGNLMSLENGRVESMVAEADSEGTAIVCHSTLHGPGRSVCRGYFDRHQSQALQIADRMALIAFDQ